MSTRFLFSPSGPPELYWRHFQSRALAMEFCAVSWPPDMEEIMKDRPNVYFKIPVVLPWQPPEAAAGFARVFDSVCALCPEKFRNQITKKDGARSTKLQLYPPIVTACAGDAALAALQLHMAIENDQLVAERRNKWEPFAAGYGCLGYYNAQAITYEPPPELDGRA